MRTTITRGLVLATTAALVTVGTAGTAQADDTTTTTFTIAAGSGLSISAPDSSDLGSAAVDASTVTAALGPVRVDDSRATLVSSWAATVSSTDFVYDVDGDAESTGDRAVIGKGSATYAPGALPSAKSSALLVVTMGLPLALDTPRQAASVTAATGSNWAEWNPTVTVDLPGTGAVAGKYTGTITHSVS